MKDIIKIIKEADNNNSLDLLENKKYIKAKIAKEFLKDFLISLQKTKLAFLESVFCLDELNTFEIVFHLSFKTGEKDMLLSVFLSREDKLPSDILSVFPASDRILSVLQELTGLKLGIANELFVPLLSSSYKGRKYPLNIYDG